METRKKKSDVILPICFILHFRERVPHDCYSESNPVGSGTYRPISFVNTTVLYCQFYPHLGRTVGCFFGGWILNPKISVLICGFETTACNPTNLLL